MPGPASPCEPTRSTLSLSLSPVTYTTSATPARTLALSAAETATATEGVAAPPSVTDAGRYVPPRNTCPQAPAPLLSLLSGSAAYVPAPPADADGPSPPPPPLLLPPPRVRPLPLNAPPPPPHLAAPNSLLNCLRAQREEWRVMFRQGASVFFLAEDEACECPPKHAQGCGRVNVDLARPSRFCPFGMIPPAAANAASSLRLSSVQLGFALRVSSEWG